MSFLPSPGHLLGADLWADDLRSIIHGRRPIHELRQWECYPTSLCNMIEWAAMARHPSPPDRRRSHLLVYKTLPTPEPCNALYPVSVRIYGFLDRFCVGDFGNWNGDCTRTANAVQSLSLSSMGNSAAWRNQLDRLNLMASFASHVLKIPLPSIQFRHHLHMQRKVFTKNLKHPFELQEARDRLASPTQIVTPQNAHVPRLPEYPWQWSGPLEILEMGEDGNIMPSHEVLLSRGDFVEIDAEFDLVIILRLQSARPSQARICIMLSPRITAIAALQPTGPSLSAPSPTEVRRMRTDHVTEGLPDVFPSESSVHEPNPASSSQLVRRHSTSFL
ncbi:hypothetical protein M404DRAFT_20963 [Pisolithus tinctorius Marx 270]|uniref:Uncharacterized protein n=1 Tax=Pisolithus tinctorius Marx 270 TaxID=870435 RepID=A0A0C3PP76_PISTI|nr:hypothetical protein M404DRAFT_20963 [Pisolithus tinctorius Marx 270]